MTSDFDETLERGLRGYVRHVSGTLRISGDCWCVDMARPASAYLALDGHLTGYPGRDVALLWDERQGWSVAVETHSGEDLLLVAYLGGQVLPSATKVARWVGHLFASDNPARLCAGPVPADARFDLPRSLKGYALPSENRLVSS